MKYRAADHRLRKLVRWDPAENAQRIDGDILLSPGISHAFVVASDKGDVVINTGTRMEGARHRERFEQILGRKLDVRAIVITQHHPDHMGGWQAFMDPGTEIIAHKNYPWLWHERNDLDPFFNARSRRMQVVTSQGNQSLQQQLAEIKTLTTFGEHHSFEVSGRKFDLYSTPSGETWDGIVVWLPAERVVFTGNLMGALPGSLPHFYTPRGDRDRSLVIFMRDMKLLIDLKPRLLIMGHGDPISGEKQVNAYLTKLRDAVQFIHDETIKGMNAGKDLPSLMREIALPKHLEHMPGRGPVAWYVRAMWEEFTGWFRHDSTTELYGVPQREIWEELVQMAGGLDKLVEHAKAHVAAGAPLKALHFTDIVTHIQPDHRAARETEIAALEQLEEEGRGQFHDLQGWLESAVARAKAAIEKH